MNKIEEFEFLNQEYISQFKEDSDLEFDKEYIQEFKEDLNEEFKQFIQEFKED